MLDFLSFPLSPFSVLTGDADEERLAPPGAHGAHAAPRAARAAAAVVAGVAVQGRGRGAGRGHDVGHRLRRRLEVMLLLLMLLLACVRAAAPLVPQVEGRRKRGAAGRPADLVRGNALHIFWESPGIERGGGGRAR